MSKPIVFRGLCTALVTPMKEGKVDYATLEKLIDFQVENGVDALLLLGTTGEASTLSRAERKEVAKLGGKMIGGRVKYVLGCGSNDTATALLFGEEAVECGADGILVVTPYYNKGTENGVISHHLTIAEKIPLPQVLYHVPSRTGVHYTLRQIKALSLHPNIVALKEADTNMDWLQDEMQATGDDLFYYAGNDSLAIPTLSLGGIGLISVISNVFPAQTRAILRLFWEGKGEESLQLARRYLPFMRMLFAETNPAPVKYALSCLGMGTGEMRLPLTYISEDLQENIKKEMDRLKA